MQMTAAAASDYSDGQIMVLEYIASLPNTRHGPWDSSATVAAALNNQVCLSASECLWQSPDGMWQSPDATFVCINCNDAQDVLHKEQKCSDVQ